MNNIGGSIMDIFRRVLALLLAMVMVMGELPAVALADMVEQTEVTETTVPETVEPTRETETVAVEAVMAAEPAMEGVEEGTSAPEVEATMGQLGQIDWYFYGSDGQLALYADELAPMPSLDSAREYPWFHLVDRIKKITVGNISSIGDYAFANCTGLTSFSFDYRIEELGNFIFDGCSALSKLNFDGSAPEFSPNTFYGVTATVTYPTGDTSWVAEKRQNYGGNLTWPGGSTADIDSGTCGDGLTWCLDSAYTLTISGIGAMEDYENGGSPWYKYIRKILRVEIFDGVTTIGANAFEDCSSITEVVIPESVSMIGPNAFGACSELEEITIPEDVAVLETQVFSGCCGLTEMVIPEGVTTIGDMAFMSCMNLERVTVPASVTEIGGWAFFGCSSLTDITMAGDAPAIADDALEGVTATVYYPAGNATWTEDVLQQSYGGNITWVAAEEDVEEGGGQGQTAIGGTYGDNVTWTLSPYGDLMISGEGAMADQTSGAAYPWYEYRAQITNIIVNGLTGIGDYAFAGAYTVNRVELGETVTYVGSHILDGFASANIVVFMGMPPVFEPDAFAGLCSTGIGYRYPLREAWEPYTENIYGGEDLWWAQYVMNVADGTMDDLYWQLMEDGELRIRSRYGNENIVLPDMEEGEAPWMDYADQITILGLDKVESIGSYAFKGLSNVAVIGFCETLSSIGEEAFADCTGLESVWFMRTLTNIGPRAFADCTSLVDINFMGTVDTVGENAFRNVTASVYCYENWPEEKQKNYGGTLTWHYVEQVAEWIDGGYMDGIYWDLYNDGHLALYADDLTPMPGVEPDMDFPWYSYADQITKITTANITTIADSAFSGCTGLTSFLFDSHITELGDYIFYGCTNLSRLTFLGSAPEFCVNTFYSVTATVAYPTADPTWTADKRKNYNGNLTWLDGEGGESGGEDVEEVIISGTCGADLTWTLNSEGVLTVSGAGDMSDFDTMFMQPEWARAAESIKQIVIEEGVTSVGSYAFFGDYLNVTRISLPQSLTRIEAYAFGFGSFTGTLTIPDAVTEIGYEAFRGCSGITELKLGSGLETIGDGAFAGCHNLSGTVTIPASVTQIGRNVFEFSSNISHIRFESTNCPAIADNSLGKISGLQSIYVPAANYDSYAALIANLPGSVEVQTDVNAFPVEGLAVSAVYSKTAVLTWNAHESGKALGYQILRDGEFIGTTAECAYTDRDLETEQTYVYTVRAYFAENAPTADSEAVSVTTVLPQIAGLTGYTEYANRKLFADVCNEIRVCVSDRGNLKPLGQQQNTLGLYYRAEDEEILIGWARQEEADSGNYSILWDLSTLSDGEYTLRAVLTDVDGTTAQWEETVMVDNTPPGKLLQSVAVGSEENIQLSWTRAQEYDAAGYHIYRSVGEEGTYAWLARIDGAATLSFTDKTAPEDQTCYYYVVAVDIFGREALDYDVVSGSRITDTEKPRVIQMLPASGSYLNGTVNFTLKAEDNVGVVTQKLEYSADAEQTWTELTAVDGKYTLDTAALEDGQITLRAFAGDAAGNLSDPFRQVYIIDNTGPEKVIGMSHVATSVTMTLRWEDVADQDIGGFRVEQLQEDGSYKVVAEKVTALGVNLQGLTPNTEYTYRVLAYDLLGNPGEPSDPYTASTEADTTAPVAVQILPNPGSFSEEIWLTATVEDDSCITSATLEYSLDTVRWKEIRTETYSDGKAVQKISARLSLEDIPEGLLYVRVTAVDRAGNRAEDPAFVQHMVDKTGPEAPAGVNAIGCSGYVEVRWNAVSDAVAYQICRAESSDGEFLPVSANHTALNYFDRNVEDGETYYYRVAATDAAGNVGQFCETVSAQASPDTQAPEILSIAPAEGSLLSSSAARISVMARDNRELASVLVEYSHDGIGYATLVHQEQINAYGGIAAARIPVAEFAHGDTVYLRAVATDAAGNSCKATVVCYTMDLEAPVVSDVTANYGEGTVVLSWSGGNEPDLAGYRIYRRNADGVNSMIGQVAAESGRSAYTWTDDTLPKEGGIFSYQIEAVDAVGNTATGSSTETVPGENTPVVQVPERSGPTAILVCDSVMTSGVEYIIDGSGSVDDGYIVSYAHDFGDGTVGSGKSAVHSYAAEGSYVLSLTVTDNEGNTHTAARKVVVKGPNLTGNVTVRIVDEKGAPVPNAPVYFDLGEENQVIRGTDASGYVSFTAEVGRHSVGCVILNNQWLPVKRDLIVKAGETTSVSMTLINKPIVEGSFEIKRMTLEEIEAAGIDLSDPANQYYVEVVLHLEYGNVELSESIPYDALTGGRQVIFDFTGKWKPKKEDDDEPDPVVIVPNIVGGEDIVGGVRGWYMELIDKSEDPKLMILDIPIGVQSLKEMFDVRLHILNNASGEFSMKDNVVTLDIPSGLSVVTDAYMASGKTVNIAEIPGQTQKTVEWIVRGDRPGEYKVGADYSGTLSQFNEPLTARFEAKEPIQVYGMSGLKLEVIYADQLDKGTLYYNVMLTNDGEVDVYKPVISTADILIEMELFDQTGRLKAEMVDYSAESISKIGLATSLNALPDVLKVGESLMIHYMCIDQTDYTHCKMKLQDQALDYQNTYGLTDENVKHYSKPLSYFKGSFSASINPVEKAQQTLNENADAYERLMDNYQYISWCIANDLVPEHYMPDDAEEMAWEFAQGEFLTSHDADMEQAKALILELLALTADATEEAQYSTFFKWLGAVSTVVRALKMEGISKAQSDAFKDTFSYLTDTFQMTYQYMVDNKFTFDELFVRMWEIKCEEKGAKFVGDESAKQILHEVYAREEMVKAWKHIGLELEVAEKVVKGLEETAVDVGVYLKAQANVETYLFLLNQLILNADTPEMESAYTKADTWIVVDSLTEIRDAIAAENFVGKLADNVLENIAQMAQGKAVDWATDKLLEVAGASASGIFKFAKVLVKVTAMGLDALMNISEQYKKADNLKFIAILSDAAAIAVNNAQAGLNGSVKKAEEFMELLTLMLDIRALGESQLALYGKSFETPFTLGNLSLLKAVRKMSYAEEATSWYQWRNIVEDRISRLRVELLRNPVTTEVTGREKPTVSFDYQNSRTIQSFDSGYEYSLDMGSTWTTCSGGPIEVQRPETSVELWVRRVNRSQTDMVGTGAVIIYGPRRLYNSGIEVLKTPTGYRIENLNGDKRYRVTFSAIPLTVDYESELELLLPEGSNSYALDTKDEYRYVYIRTLADKDSYASHIAGLNTVSTVTLKTYTTGEGLIMDHESVREYGSEVSLTAVPGENRFFDGWYRNGVKVSGDATYVFRIYSSLYLEARFVVADEVTVPGVSAAVDPLAGTAAVELTDGTTVAVSGIPRDAFKLVVETVTEGTAADMVGQYMEDLGIPARIYDIYLLDDRLERMQEEGLTISVKYSGSREDMILCGIGQDGTVNVLQTKAAEDGSMTFCSDGSALYVLAALLPQRYISLETTEDVLLPGQTAELRADFEPANPTDTKILWSLAEGDSVYATLTYDGNDAVLTALKATGSCYVTVTAAAADGSFPATSVQILVLPPVYQLDIQRDGETVTGKEIRFDLNREDNADGNMLELTAVAAPEDALQEVTWQSSNEDIAEVTENGLVTFLGETGLVKITAAATDGSGKTAVVTIRVVALTQRVQMAEGSITELVGGKSAKFQALDADSGAVLTSTQLVWSLDEEYAPYATIAADGTLKTRVVAEETKIVITGRVVGNEEVGVVEHTVTLRPLTTYVELWYDDRAVNGETIVMDTDGATAENLPAISLEAVLHPGDAMDGVVWKSKDTDIATVSQDGTVTVKWDAKKEVCKAGTVTITATASDGSKAVGEVNIRFGVLVKQVEIEAPDLELRSGKRMTLTASTTPSKPTVSGVTWSLAGEDDSDFASISSSGKLTAKTVYEEHTVLVRATAKDGSGVYDEIPVLIKPKKDGILTIHADGKNVTKDTVSVDLTEPAQIVLEAYTLDEYEMEAVSWKTSSKKVATLTDNGDGSVTVTLLKSGAATITATAADGRTASVTVKGVKLTEKITVTSSSEEMTVASGKSITLKALVEPSNATSKAVQWSVAQKDAEYASISTSGKLTAAKNLQTARTVTVIAAAKDGGAVQEAEVLLTPLSTAIALLIEGKTVTNTTEIHNMVDNATLQVEAAVYPLDHASGAVTWKSSNKKIASIDQDGVITCKKAGEVTITATAADGSKVKAIFKLKVEKWMTELTLPETALIAGGKTLTMTKLDGYYVDAYATNKTLYWSMEGEGAAFATLSAKGVLKTKAVTEPKSLTVTATAADGGQICASCEVTIYPATTKVTVLCDGETVTKTLTLAVGETLDLDGACQPISAADEYTWKSSSTKYATVDEDGVVTAKKAGKTISISCMAADGSGKSTVVKIKIVK